MQKLFVSFFLILVIISFANCGSSPCGVATLNYGLIDFSDAESQNIVIRKFEKNSNFSNKIDSFIVQARFKRSNDTLEVSSISSDELLFSQFDYEMVFQSASRLYRITNIIEEQSEMKYSILRPRKDGCINKITQLTINGQITNTERFNSFYIVK